MIDKKQVAIYLRQKRREAFCCWLGLRIMRMANWLAVLVWYCGKNVALFLHSDLYSMTRKDK